MALAVIVGALRRPCRSAFSCALKSSRGRSRRSSATRNSSATRGSRVADRMSRSAIIASTASLSWLLKAPVGLRLAMGPIHSCAQTLQPPKLQLFDGAFAASQVQRDFPNALLLGEAHLDHAALVARKLIDELKQAGAILRFLHANLLGDLEG